jgi:hypothetical protein
MPKSVHVKTLFESRPSLTQHKRHTRSMQEVRENKAGIKAIVARLGSSELEQ